MAAKRKPKSVEPAVEIKLSPTQVEEVVRAVRPSRAPGFAEMITTVLGRTETEALADNDPRTSRSLLRGLAVLACFDTDDESLGIMEIADRLGINPSTVHRYLLTLVQVGLLEQSQETRRYSLANARKRKRRHGPG